MKVIRKQAWTPDMTINEVPAGAVFKIDPDGVFYLRLFRKDTSEPVAARLDSGVPLRMEGQRSCCIVSGAFVEGKS